MVVHPGTPETRVMGRWGHDAAVSAGVRLIALNRPGLRWVDTDRRREPGGDGEDTAALAAHLGLDEYAVFGLSGGGPFAVATAIADPSPRSCARRRRRDRSVADHRPRQRPRRDQVPGASRCGRCRRCPGLHAPRRRACVWRLRRARRRRTRRRGSSPASARGVVCPRSRLTARSGRTTCGCSWPASTGWSSTTWPGEPDGTSTLATSRPRPCCCTGSRIRRARLPMDAGTPIGSRTRELVVLPGERHLDVIDGHWPEVLAGLLALWASR